MLVASSAVVLVACGDEGPQGSSAAGGQGANGGGSGAAAAGTAGSLAGTGGESGGAARGGVGGAAGNAAGASGSAAVSGAAGAGASGGGSGGVGGAAGGLGGNGGSAGAQAGSGAGGMAGDAGSGAGTAGGGVAGAAGAAGTGGGSGVCAPGASSAFYVDAVNGDDAADGRSESTAWRSLAKVNVTTFSPGDELCFRAGGSFTGSLHPLGSGTLAAPIVIGSYGTGEMPKFVAGASDLDTVLLLNQSYWEVNGLEVTNEKSSLGDVRGIAIRGSNAGTLSHIYVRGCHVHDVTGVVNWIGGDTADNAPGVTFQTGWDASKRTGGIVVEVDAKNGTSQKTKFDDVRIENNVIEDTSFGGIILKQLDGTVHWGVRSSKSDSTWTPHTNVVIRNNYLSQTGTSYGCNTIYVTDVQDGLVEGNVTKGSGTSAIELYYTDRVTVQHNETFGTVRKASGADYNGIDSDKASTGTIIQYNYVHDNGDGILLAQFSFGDSVIRYNLIVNNSRYGINLHSDTSATNATYNNLFFAEGLASASLVSTSGDGSALAATYVISNNILHTTRTSDAARTGSGVTYRNNLYSGLPAVAGDSGAKTGNPMFVNPGARQNGDQSGPAFASLTGFALMAGSPALNAGVTIADNGGMDFFGTALYVGAPDIGPYEAQSP